MEMKQESFVFVFLTFKLGSDLSIYYHLLFLKNYALSSLILRLILSELQVAPNFLDAE